MISFWLDNCLGFWGIKKRGELIFIIVGWLCLHTTKTHLYANEDILHPMFPLKLKYYNLNTQLPIKLRMNTFKTHTPAPCLLVNFGSMRNYDLKLLYILSFSKVKIAIDCTTLQHNCNHFKKKKKKKKKCQMTGSNKTLNTNRSI